MTPFERRRAARGPLAPLPPNYLTPTLATRFLVVLATLGLGAWVLTRLAP